ncbi:MAG: TonB-dependent receptor [Ignavibacteriae bacterium]|nr:TonB-dependent receptor [Ignavibacteriota bacterium]
MSMWHACARMRAASFFVMKGEAFSLHPCPPHRLAVCILLAACTVLSTGPALAQQDSSRATGTDTVRTYLLHEMIVTSQRIPRPALASPSRAVVLSRRTIEATGATSLASVLSVASGLFVKDYGGVSGLKTISQRGLGTEHTLLLLNGLPANSTHNGGFDLGLFSIFDIGSVEIVQGGQSALQGAHAVAGVVNVLTRTMDVGTSLEGGVSVGSFGYRNYHLAAGDGASSVRWRVSASRETSTEDFPFDLRNGPVVYPLVRTNADVYADRLSASCTGPLGTDLRFEAMAAVLDAERGVPGVVTGPYSAGQGRQVDRTALVQASLTVVPGPSVSWETRVQGQYGYQRYRDPGLTIGFVPVDNYTTTREVHVESHAGVQVGTGTQLYVGGDVTLVKGDGNTYRREARRDAWGGAVAAEHIILGSNKVFHIVAFPALRYDHVSSSLEAWSPQLGLLLHCPVDLSFLFRDASFRVRAMTSRNFRTPTFNELYYAGGGGIGNPDLRPERSTGYEAGVGWSGRWLGEHRVDVTGFVTDMTDRIVWVSAPGGNVTPRNLRRVDSRGVEVTYAFDAGVLHVDARYTRQRSLKMSEDYPGDPNTHVPVIYAPEETAGLQGAWTYETGVHAISAIDLSAGFTFVGHRFITEDAQGFLPAYHVMSGGVGVSLAVRDVRMHLQLQVDNALGASYEVMAGYPMPPRSFRLSCDVSY